MRRTLMLCLLMLSGQLILAQEYFPKNDGVKAENENYQAFTNAVIHAAPGQVIQNGTLLVRGKEIVSVGTSVQVPKNAVVVDLKGKHIYPSFIDVYSAYGIHKPKAPKQSGRTSQYHASREGYYWNDHVRPERRAQDHYHFDATKAEDLLKMGFGLVNTHQMDGIVQGSGMLVALNTNGGDQDRILDSRSGQYFSFHKSVLSKQSYPTSLMGSMALLRQMYIDADWYAAGNSKTKDLSLEALNANKDLVQFFDAGDKNNALRAASIGKQYGAAYVIYGAADGYELLEDLKATGSTFVLPLNFPKPYDVEDPHNAQYVSLASMKDWNLAPTNPMRFAEQDIAFAFTLNGMEKQSDFQKQVRRAQAYGLSEEDALAALTTVPAKILKMESKLGSLKAGALANFSINSGSIFEKNNTMYAHYVQGKAHRFEDLQAENPIGQYSLQLNGQNYDWTLSGKPSSLNSSLEKGGEKRSSKAKLNRNTLHLYFEDSPGQGYYRLSGKLEGGKIQGSYVDAKGAAGTWTASKTGPGKDSKKEITKHEVAAMRFPNNGYGYAKKPEAKSYLFKGVTVWTNEAEGILENTDVLVKDGKIAKIGKDLKAGKAEVVDGQGKHLTSGIIDEHSHIATHSTNEAGHNSTAEVTMEDAINFEDVNIYRNLAGGVTQIQILHGSANPIGGRSAIVKLKWGEKPEQMIDPKAPKFIKFALGENVKQSNWGSYSRFPQTRMGVEQVYVDYFQRAKEYDQKKKAGQSQRRDIELEVLAEILNEERFISCHSYVQSEINMLMKVAESFDFKVNTFTHILEGYKVADKMAAHGAAGSTFSDWWAYKYEVNDAIPYNAAIMHSQGVVTAINSDDAEMSRRLNQEAAKVVKYGGVSEEDAWKMVTLNPAKMLHIDQYVGSVKEGKDADLVLWTAHPLSVGAKAEKTMIEGTVYFDLEQDAQLRAQTQEERRVLIDQMLNEKQKGSETRKAEQVEHKLNHCDTVD